MTPATASTGTIRLVSGIAAATILSATAVLAVLHTGCDDPGSYAEHDDGVVELIGGCLSPEDLPVAPDSAVETGTRPLHGTTDPSLAP